MDNLLHQLREVGVNSIKTNRRVILEFLEDSHEQAVNIDMLINELLSHLKNSKLEEVMFECPESFFHCLNVTKTKMRIIGERVVYHRNFKTPLDIVQMDFKTWTIDENISVSFLSEVMNKNFIDTKKFLVGMRNELPSQADKMYTVGILNDKPVGVVFPHIEPNTDQEGRIFWIGIHPDFLGKGLGKNLHLIGLQRLKAEFNAKTYLGITARNNVQMRKVMISNNCTQNDNTLISLKYPN